MYVLRITITPGEYIFKAHQRHFQTFGSMLKLVGKPNIFSLFFSPSSVPQEIDNIYIRNKI